MNSDDAMSSNDAMIMVTLLLWQDTFHHAWRALEAPFTMIPAPVGSAGKGRSADDFRGSTMVSAQHVVCMSDTQYTATDH